MLERTLRIGLIVFFKGRGQKLVVTGRVWRQPHGGRDVSAGVLMVAPAEVHFAQAPLDLRHHVGGKASKPSQLAQRLNGVVRSSQGLKLPAPLREPIDEVERRAHGAASLQRLPEISLRSRAI